MDAFKEGRFRDRENREHFVEISMSDRDGIEIKLFDSYGNPSGYMYLNFLSNKRIFLNSIYCYSTFRRSGIATIMNDLADYLLRHYLGYVIIGAYQPFRASFDDAQISNEELDFAARTFYETKGYQIIKYSDFLNSRDKYSDLSCSDFFLCGDVHISTLVTKKIKRKRYPFYEKNGTIYQDERGRIRKRFLLWSFFDIIFMDVIIMNIVIEKLQKKKLIKN